MDDLISRQAAIDAVKGRFSMPVDNLIVEVIGALPSAQPEAHVIKLRMDIDKDAFLEAWKAAQKDMTFLPPENDGWIPVSERLPEKRGCYLVTNSDHAEFEADINYWVDGHWLFPNDNPIAWRPLPEPYKGDEE